MFCPKCGSEIPKSAKWCPKCGSQIERTHADSSEAGATQHRNTVTRKEALALGAAALAALVVGNNLLKGCSNSSGVEGTSTRSINMLASVSGTSSSSGASDPEEILAAWENAFSNLDPSPILDALPSGHADAFLSYRGYSSADAFVSSWKNDCLSKLSALGSRFDLETIFSEATFKFLYSEYKEGKTGSLLYNEEIDDRIENGIVFSLSVKPGGTYERTGTSGSVETYECAELIDWKEGMENISIWCVQLDDGLWYLYDVPLDPSYMWTVSQSNTTESLMNSWIEELFT